MANAVSRVTSVRSGVTANGGSWELYKIFDSELVNGTADVDSLFDPGAVGFELSQFMTFGLYVVLTGTTPDVAFQILQSFDNTAANYAVPDIDGTIITVTDTNIHIVTVSPTPMPFLRIRANGQGSNGSNVTATAYIWMQTS